MDSAFISQIANDLSSGITASDQSNISDIDKKSTSLTTPESNKRNEIGLQSAGNARNTEKILEIDGCDETGCFLFGAEDENWYGAWFPSQRRLRSRLKPLPEGRIWMFRTDLLLHEWTRWCPAEIFLDSRKILIVRNKSIVLLIPILDVRTEVPKSLLHWRRKSHRRLAIAAHNWNGIEGLTSVMEVKLDTPEKQCKLRQLIIAFRKSTT